MVGYRNLFSSGVSLAFNCSFCFFFSSLSLIRSASSLCRSFSSSSSLSLLEVLLDEYLFFFLLFLCLDSRLSLLVDLCFDGLGESDRFRSLLLAFRLLRCSSDLLLERSRRLISCLDDLLQDGFHIYYAQHTKYNRYHSYSVC